MTLMSDARKGITTEDVKKAAKYEGIDPEIIRRGVAEGRIVIPHNPIHKFSRVLAIGDGTSVKINANIGTSKDFVNVEEEVKKAKIAEKYGADAIMDLSTGGDLQKIRRKIMDSVDIMMGTVPIYHAGIDAIKKFGSVVDMTEDHLFNAIESHAKDGVDFMTVHCGVNKESVQRLKRQGRITNIVSRGGAFLAAWILHNNKENPLYAQYDYLLEMAKKYDFTLSLGDGLRPGCIADATDRPQVQELIILGELVDRARSACIQSMVEGPGHVPYNQIAANMQIQKTLCRGAPFYVLGPLVTDIAPGYDHITGAIGGTLAAVSGADFLCYVTPAEHLSLPTIEDVRAGTVASKIAAHAADLAKGNKKAWEQDLKMAEARRKLDWKAQAECALDPEMARERRKKRMSSDDEVCSMCGPLCAIKLVNEYLKK